MGCDYYEHVCLNVVTLSHKCHDLEFAQHRCWVGFVDEGIESFDAALKRTMQRAKESHPDRLIYTCDSSWLLDDEDLIVEHEHLLKQNSIALNNVKTLTVSHWYEARA